MTNAKELMAKRLQAGETIYNYKESGNSMTPLITSRQPVDIVPIDREIEVGDMVFCRIGARFYSHLVTALTKNSVQISNNHGHVNGWTPKKRVYGFLIPK